MTAPWLFLLAFPGPVDGDPPAPRERFTAEQRDHWAYRPIARPAVPEVDDGPWSRNPIDRFLRAAMAASEFEPAPEADRVALIRRVTSDLHGLPPAPEELADEEWDRRIDRLLASPRFGERWTQHWLDLAHYADSNGFELDAERPDAWRYRDWVVDAFNDDMPYDRFLTLQLAGDEAEPGNAAALIATGFGRCGPREVVGGNIDPEVRRQAELTEVASTVGSVALGLTIGCARCHDHKFDAIPTTDHYRLRALFAGAQMDDVDIAPAEEKSRYQSAVAAIDARIKPLKAELAALEAPYRARLREAKKAKLTPAESALLATPAEKRTPEQKKLAAGIGTTLKVSWEEVAAAVAAGRVDLGRREMLKRAIHAIEVTRPRPPAKAMALHEPKPEAPETWVLRRGDVKNRGPRVEPGPPGIVLASMPADSFAPSPTPNGTGRRLAFARWLARPDNPLTARVIVNRLWMHHFGRGLVATPSDWGVQGAVPTHPELLDWLASELIAGGWHLKPIHRLMVTSAAYRQSSGTIRPRQLAADPTNDLVSRIPRRRLDAESYRDAMLAASGEINPRMGGPGVLVPIERDVEDLIFTESEEVDLWPVDPDPAEHVRRSLYLFRKRNVRYSMFDALDAPDTQNACPQRNVSTHALQALTLLNGDFALGRAKALAGRLYLDVPGADRDRVARLYAIAYARAPSEAESARALAFVESQARLLRDRAAAGLQVLAAPSPAPAPWVDPAEAAAWVDLALAVLNSNEFAYVP